jgi:tetratricopeptide (TPR) repeat protein
MNAVGSVAELHAYLGENERAQQLLAPYIVDSRVFIGGDVDIPIRAKLQIFEFFYSKREFSRAIDIGLILRQQAAEKGDLWGEGEALYYLARVYSRLDEYMAVDDCCEQATQRFAACAPIAGNSGVSWRIGQVSLAAGWSRWRRGDLTAATSKLYVARWLLGSTGDFISSANVDNTLGILFRSQGRYDDSLRALDDARRQYEMAGHRLNLARALTNIGRTYLDQGDSRNAAHHLESALALVGAIDHLRQRAEVLLCLSWVHQRSADPDMKTAALYAKEAADLAANDRVNSRWLRVESSLALGHCRRADRDYPEAARLFHVALAEASEHRLRKLEATAHLSISDLHCGLGDISNAHRHLHKADAILTRDSSHYLTDFAKRISERLDRMQSDFFIVTNKELNAGGAKLRDVERRYDAWAIREALALTNNRKGRAAKLLGISRQALDKRLRRPRSFSTMQHRPDAGDAHVGAATPGLRATGSACSV